MKFGIGDFEVCFHHSVAIGLVLRVGKHIAVRGVRVSRYLCIVQKKFRTQIL